MGGLAGGMRWSFYNVCSAIPRKGSLEPTAGKRAHTLRHLQAGELRGDPSGGKARRERDLVHRHGGIAERFQYGGDVARIVARGRLLEKRHLAVGRTFPSEA